MKIAILVDQFPAISETFILNHITALVDRGIDVDIIAQQRVRSDKYHPDVDNYGLMTKAWFTDSPVNPTARVLKAVRLLPGELWRSKGAIVRTFDAIQFRKESASLRLFYLARGFIGKDYDIIHCHYGPNGMNAVNLLLSGIHKSKVITTFHGFDLSMYLKANGIDAYSNLFRHGTLFLPISDYWKRLLIQNGCPEEKTVVHRMGVDLEKFTFRDTPLSRGGKVQILSVSRLAEKKGLEYGLRAVAILKGKGVNLEYKIVGAGPLDQELRMLSKSLGLEGTVSFLGRREQTEILEHLRSADIFLTPSVTARSGDQEGIPVVLMEASAIGVPAVSTFHTGIPELIEDGATGLLAPERDFQALASKLMLLIEQPALGDRLRRSARRRVERDFDNRKLNDRLVELYSNLHS